MIEARSLTKVYADLRRGPFVALDGLSFSAQSGEVFGLLGPNGAGKTTALRILSTVLVPTSGTATVNDFDCVTQPDMVRHHIGSSIIKLVKTRCGYLHSAHRYRTLVQTEDEYYRNHNSHKNAA